MKANPCHERRIVEFLETRMIFDKYACIKEDDLIREFEEYLSTLHSEITPALLDSLKEFIGRKSVRTMSGSHPLALIYYRGIRPQTDRDREDLAKLKAGFDACAKGVKPEPSPERKANHEAAVSRAAKGFEGLAAPRPLRPYLHLDRLTEDLSVIGQDYARALDTLYAVCLIAGIDGYDINTNSIDPGKIRKGVETLKSRFTLALPGFANRG